MPPLTLSAMRVFHVALIGDAASSGSIPTLTLPAERPCTSHNSDVWGAVVPPLNLVASRAHDPDDADAEGRGIIVFPSLFLAARSPSRAIDIVAAATDAPLILAARRPRQLDEKLAAADAAARIGATPALSLILTPPSSFDAAAAAAADAAARTGATPALSLVVARPSSFDAAAAAAADAAARTGMIPALSLAAASLGALLRNLREAELLAADAVTDVTHILQLLPQEVFPLWIAPDSSVTLPQAITRHASAIVGSIGGAVTSAISFFFGPWVRRSPTQVQVAESEDGNDSEDEANRRLFI